MLITIIVLLASAVLIYFSCELFVNGIEWTGHKFKISSNAVGTILAAFGTALPESVVTLIAVVFGTSSSQKDIGVGAALGGPLVLSTIAYAVVGWSLLAYRGHDKINLDDQKLSRDQLWFISIFIFKAALGFVSFAGKAWTSLLFIIAYGFYFHKEMSAQPATNETIVTEPLKFRPRKSEPETRWVLFQTFLALGLIFIGSHIFVDRLESLSVTLEIAPHLIALILSPVATELPEILNAIIWIRQGKEMLALGNISGAMMIQATIPSALGIFFTPWIFDRYLAMAAIITLLSISFLWLTLRRNKLSVGRLSFAALFYLAFALGAVLMRR